MAAAVGGGVASAGPRPGPTPVVEAGAGRGRWTPRLRAPLPRRLLLRGGPERPAGPVGWSLPS